MKPIFTHTGNTLVEYILPCALLGIIVLAGASQLMNLNPADSGMIAGTDSYSANDKKMTMRPFGIVSNADALQAGAYSDDAATSAALAQVGIGSIKEKIETIGSQGTTEELLAALVKSAKNYEKEGVLTADQLSKFNDLANAGHELAQVEGLIENSAKLAGNNKTRFAKSRQKLGNQLFSPNQLAQMLGGNPRGTKSTQSVPLKNLDDETLQTFSLSREDYMGKLTYKFLTEFQDLNRSGALNHPEIKPLVKALSQQVRGIAQNVAGAANGASDASQKNRLPSALTQEVASGTTHNDSKVICDTGDGTDTGTACR
jgi:hypothetical protein